MVRRARLLRHRKWLWRVEQSTRHPEGVRYQLAFIRSGEKAPAVLYDNHHPKGHHRHVEAREETYSFTVQQLIADFNSEVNRLRGDRRK